MATVSSAIAPMVVRRFMCKLLGMQTGHTLMAIGRRAAGAGTAAAGT
jgi:hypothetical protein